MSSDGKSLGDVLLAALHDWRTFSRLVLLVFALTAVLTLAVVLTVSNLPSSASEVQLGAAHILFSQSTKDGDKYVVIVTPQGWQRTGISVAEGSTFAIESDGRVHIDLAGLNDALKVRRAAEDRVTAARGAQSTASGTNGGFIPDDYFTDAERKAMIPTWGWIGPNGVPQADMEKHANRERWKRTIVPTTGYGTLVGAFLDQDIDPATVQTMFKQLVANAFIVGSNFRQKATTQKSGFLYFTVNDVQGGETEPAEEFFIDNIGAFYAKITVTSR